MTTRISILASLTILIATAAGATPQQAIVGTRIQESRPVESVHPSPSPVPLLVISRGRFSAYLLPESHVGYPGEFGPYFQSRVIAAARRAHTLVYEGADLDPWVDWRYFYRSCLDGRPEVGGLNSRFTNHLVTHHRHSFWHSLRVTLPDLPDISAEEQFRSFIETRSLLVNFLEVYFRVWSFLERELAVLHSPDRQLTVQEHFVEFSAHTRIARKFPKLARESIESLDDFAWAICALEPNLAGQMLEQALEGFESLERDVLNREPGALFRVIGDAFRAMNVQLGLAEATSLATLSPLFDRGGRVRSETKAQLLPGISLGLGGEIMLLGLRNQRWAERIDEHARAGRKGLFYVFGAMHLLDYEHFDGLLTLLEQRGFTIQVVRPDGRLEPLNQRLSSKSRPTAPSSSLQWTGTHR